MLQQLIIASSQLAVSVHVRACACPSFFLKPAALICIKSRLVWTRVSARRAGLS